MTEVINTLVFSIGLLFGYDASIYSESTLVTINEQDQSITLEYRNLQAPARYLDQAVAFKDSIDQASGIAPELQGLSLLDKQKSEENGITSFIVKLKYASNEALKTHFKIDLDSSRMALFKNEDVFLDGKKLETNNDPPLIQLEQRRGGYQFEYRRKDDDGRFSDMKSI